MNIRVRNPINTAVYVAASQHRDVVFLSTQDTDDLSIRQALHACLPHDLVDTAWTDGCAYGVIDTPTESKQIMDRLTQNLPIHGDTITRTTIVFLCGSEYQRAQPDRMSSLLIYKHTYDAGDVQQFKTISALNDVVG